MSTDTAVLVYDDGGPLSQEDGFAGVEPSMEFAATVGGLYAVNKHMQG